MQFRDSDIRIAAKDGMRMLPQLVLSPPPTVVQTRSRRRVVERAEASSIALAVFGDVDLASIIMQQLHTETFQDTLVLRALSRESLRAWDEIYPASRVCQELFPDTRFAACLGQVEDSEEWWRLMSLRARARRAHDAPLVPTLPSARSFTISDYKLVATVVSLDARPLFVGTRLLRARGQERAVNMSMHNMLSAEEAAEGQLFADIQDDDVRLSVFGRHLTVYVQRADGAMACIFNEAQPNEFGEWIDSLEAEWQSEYDFSDDFAASAGSASPFCVECGADWCFECGICHTCNALREEDRVILGASSQETLHKGVRPGKAWNEETMRTSFEAELVRPTPRTRVLSVPLVLCALTGTVLCAGGERRTARRLRMQFFPHRAPRPHVDAPLRQRGGHRRADAQERAREAALGGHRIGSRGASHVSGVFGPLAGTVRCGWRGEAEVRTVMR